MHKFIKDTTKLSILRGMGVCLGGLEELLMSEDPVHA